MPFNVQEFRGALAYDGARGNLFDVQITIPNIIEEAAAAAEKITFLARTSQLPGDTIGTVITHYFGREVKLPGNRTFPEWTVTIVNDEDFITRNALERWMSYLNSHVGNLRDAAMLSSANYSSDAWVSQYGKTGDIVKEYKFVGLFPTDLSPIDVDWSDNDSVETYTATFAFQWWESDSSTDSVGATTAPGA